MRIRNRNSDVCSSDVETGRVNQESGAWEGVGTLLPGNDRDRTSNIGSELLGPLPVSIGKAQRRHARIEKTGGNRARATAGAEQHCGRRGVPGQIGRASCRERVCPYV